jgi:hypothetical protein
MAGFLLSQAVSRDNMRYQQSHGVSVGTFRNPKSTYQQRGRVMALTDTFIRQVKHSGAPAGDKHTDGQGLFLLINAVGKYWRMNYRFTGKQKTLALGVYPAVSLAKARQRRDKARELLADGIDPGQAKRDDKQAKADAAAHNASRHFVRIAHWTSSCAIALAVRHTINLDRP